MHCDIQRETTCAFTGHRPEKMPFPVADESDAFQTLLQRLDLTIRVSILKGYRHFITGMSRGLDLWAAQSIAYYKTIYPDITLEAAIPHPEQTRRWSTADKQLYSQILASCDKQTLISSAYVPGSMHARNRYMVDHASLLIAAFDPAVPGGTEYTVDYAQKKNVRVVNLLDAD